MSGEASPHRGPSIAWFALGYFATYVPYSALTKALSDGLFRGGPLPGLALLPVSNVASMLSMVAFLSAAGWWRYAGRGSLFGFELPRPGPWTFLSGLATAAVVVTTTLAYTFQGASIVFMMLLMRGGVLVLAPAVDLATGRPVRWFSWLALALSLASLLAAFVGRPGFGLSALAALDVAVYLAAYFVRLRLMSRLAKADDPALSRRYFVEEQMVATPAVVLALAALALAGPAAVAAPLGQGFTSLGSPSVWLLVALVGALSQGNGIFGGLVLLDRRENSFCVPINRASSMLAGLGATLLLWALLGEAPPSPGELAGALLVAVALGALSLPDVLGSWWAGRRAA
jgi:drug/metabolite transporter (DMT)-like permease